MEGGGSAHYTMATITHMYVHQLCKSIFVQSHTRREHEGPTPQYTREIEYYYKSWGGGGGGGLKHAKGGLVFPITPPWIRPWYLVDVFLTIANLSCPL